MKSTDIEEFLDYHGRIRDRTERVATRIPPGRIEWRPRPDAFSFGDVLRHVGALERYMFVENALLRPSRYPGHGIELAEGHAAVLAFLRRTHEESVEMLRTLEPADLERRCTTPAGAELRVWKWLRAMVEHEVHHRGQLYLLLADLGVDTPPLYGLTSEEVRARSEPAETGGPGADA